MDQEGLEASGVKTDIVCAGHSPDDEGRVATYVPLRDE